MADDEMAVDQSPDKIPTQSPEEGSTQDEDEAPHDLGDEAPSDGEDEVPSNREDEASHDLGDEAPSDIEDETSHDLGDEAPSDSEDEVPHDLGDEAPSDIEDESSHDLESEAPSDIEDEASHDLFDEAVVDVGDEAPQDLEYETSSNIEDEAPSDIEDEAPHDLESEAPSDIEDEAPHNLFDEADVGDEASVDLEDETTQAEPVREEVDPIVPSKGHENSPEVITIKDDDEEARKEKSQSEAQGTEALSAGFHRLTVYPVTLQDLDKCKMSKLFGKYCFFNLRFVEVNSAKMGFLLLNYRSADDTREAFNAVESGDSSLKVKMCLTNGLPDEEIVELCKTELSNKLNCAVLVKNLPSDVRREMLEILYPTAKNIEIPVNSRGHLGCQVPYAILDFAAMEEVWNISLRSKHDQPCIGEKTLEVMVILKQAGQPAKPTAVIATNLGKGIIKEVQMKAVASLFSSAVDIEIHGYGTAVRFAVLHYATEAEAERVVSRSKSDPHQQGENNLFLHIRGQGKQNEPLLEEDNQLSDLTESEKHCKHWLRGLCQKGGDCRFIHDTSAQPTRVIVSNLQEGVQKGILKHQLKGVFKSAVDTEILGNFYDNSKHAVVHFRTKAEAEEAVSRVKSDPQQLLHVAGSLNIHIQGQDDPVLKDGKQKKVDRTASESTKILVSNLRTGIPKAPQLKSLTDLFKSAISITVHGNKNDSCRHALVEFATKAEAEEAVSDPFKSDPQFLQARLGGHPRISIQGPDERVLEDDKQKTVDRVDLTGDQTIKVGDHVRVKPQVTKPMNKWGSINHSSIGTVTAIRSSRRDSTMITVNFPEQVNWTGLLGEMELAPVIRHYGIKCAGCLIMPITGPRHRCLTCADFNYCESCFKANNLLQVHRHLFFKISEHQGGQEQAVMRKPTTEGKPILIASGTGTPRETPAEKGTPAGARTPAQKARRARNRTKYLQRQREREIAKKRPAQPKSDPSSVQKKQRLDNDPSSAQTKQRLDNDPSSAQTKQRLGKSFVRAGVSGFVVGPRVDTLRAVGPPARIVPVVSPGVMGGVNRMMSMGVIGQLNQPQTAMVGIRQPGGLQTGIIPIRPPGGLQTGIIPIRPPGGLQTRIIPVRPLGGLQAGIIPIRPLGGLQMGTIPIRPPGPLHSGISGTLPLQAIRSPSVPPSSIGGFRPPLGGPQAGLGGDVARRVISRWDTVGEGTMVGQQGADRGKMSKVGPPTSVQGRMGPLSQQNLPDHFTITPLPPPHFEPDSRPSPCSPGRLQREMLRFEALLAHDLRESKSGLSQISRDRSRSPDKSRMPRSYPGRDSPVSRQRRFSDGSRSRYETNPGRGHDRSRYETSRGHGDDRSRYETNRGRSDRGDCSDRRKSRSQQDMGRPRAGYRSQRAQQMDVDRSPDSDEAPSRMSRKDKGEDKPEIDHLKGQLLIQLHNLEDGNVSNASALSDLAMKLKELQKKQKERESAKGEQSSRRRRGERQNNQGREDSRDEERRGNRPSTPPGRAVIEYGHKMAPKTSPSGGPIAGANANALRMITIDYGHRHANVVTASVQLSGGNLQQLGQANNQENVINPFHQLNTNLNFQQQQQLGNYPARNMMVSNIPQFTGNVALTNDQQPTSMASNHPLAALPQMSSNTVNLSTVAPPSQQAIVGYQQTLANFGRLQQPVSLVQQQPVSLVSQHTLIGSQQPVSFGNQQPVNSGNQQLASLGNRIRNQQQPVSLVQQDALIGNQQQISFGNQQAASFSNQQLANLGNKQPANFSNPISTGVPPPTSTFGNAMVQQSMGRFRTGGIALTQQSYTQMPGIAQMPMVSAANNQSASNDNLTAYVANFKKQMSQIVPQVSKKAAEQQADVSQADKTVNRKIFVRNLPLGVTHEELEKFFNKVMCDHNLAEGPDSVTKAFYVKNMYGFVMFHNADLATSAMTLDGIKFRDCNIVVRRPKNYKPN